MKERCIHLLSLTFADSVQALGLAAPLVDDPPALGRLPLLLLLQLLSCLLAQQKLQWQLAINYHWDSPKSPWANYTIILCYLLLAQFYYTS